MDSIRQRRPQKSREPHFSPLPHSFPGNTRAHPPLAGSRAEVLAPCLDKALLRLEKCDLDEAKELFELALIQAQEQGDPHEICDAYAHLLRFYSELGQEQQVHRLSVEIDVFCEKAGGAVTPLAGYCRGIISLRARKYRTAQKFFLGAWRLSQRDVRFYRVSVQIGIALGVLSLLQGKVQRSRRMITFLEKLTQGNWPRGTGAALYLLKARQLERAGDLKSSQVAITKAFSIVIEEHHWFQYLFVLHANARILRLTQDWVQSAFYLDLCERATPKDLRSLTSQIQEERLKLNLHRYDLELDLHRAVLKTSTVEIDLRRQQILLEMITQLVQHPLGIPKSSLVEKVWKEKYSPELHDSKLYYNINRLRKLVEPNMATPSVILNWRQGYRLAPDLKIRLVSADE